MSDETVLDNQDNCFDGLREFIGDTDDESEEGEEEEEEE